MAQVALLFSDLLCIQNFPNTSRVKAISWLMTLWVRNWGKFSWTIFLLGEASAQELVVVGWQWPHLEGLWLHSSTCMSRAWWAWLELLTRAHSCGPRAVSSILRGCSGLPPKKRVKKVFQETWVKVAKLLRSSPQKVLEGRLGGILWFKQVAKSSPALRGQA